MSRGIRYEPCPRCRENGRDSRGDNCLVYSDGSKHCFACKWHLFPKHYIKPNEDLPKQNKTLCPNDWTREVPAAALKWLLQYGLPWSYWKDQIGYSPTEERLVFLVGSPTQFSIGRYVGNSSQLGMALPSSTPRKWYVWGDSHKHCEVVKPPRVESAEAQDKIVLCEDLVSAHKVANAGYLAMPLFGVNWHPCHVYYLMQEHKPIVLWLDKDQAGTIMRKAMGLQALTGCAVSSVSTDKDPKALTFSEINLCLT